MQQKRLNILLIGVLLTALFIGCASNVKDGVAYLEQGNYEAAVTMFEQEIKEEKNLDEAYRGLGIALYELGEYAESAKAFEEALRQKTKETATIYHLLGASYLQTDAYEDALKYYEKALKMNDCTGEMEQEIRYNQIAIYQELGDWDTLKEKVSEYVEKYPEDDRMDKTVEFLETR